MKSKPGRVIQYMDTLFSGQNLDELYPLLAEQFQFEGPFYSFDSAESYIKAMQADPPHDFHYSITSELLQFCAKYKS